MSGKPTGTTNTKRPAGAAGAPGGQVARTSGNRGQVARRAQGGGGGSSGVGSAQQGGIWRYYTDDAAGLKLGPTTVLVMSLLFIALVVLMHIVGRFASRK
ncbi:Sec61beta family-domain-containing protein [Baffinella frigidus]|nr:Sec61beta family-domain-containing protein [Cryptophyta sp. CCMP2293]